MASVLFALREYVCVRRSKGEVKEEEKETLRP